MSSAISEAATNQSRVRVVEVGPRDGLQNESGILRTDDKVRFIELLAGSGLKEIEASSFVNPARVPQLADAEAVFARLHLDSGVRYSALVANERGLDRALVAEARAVALFTAASEAFTERNIGMSIAGSLSLFRSLADRAHREGLWVRAYISTAFDCPFSGPTPIEQVLNVAGALLGMGVDEISVADTIGTATPEKVVRLTEALLPILPVEQFAYHFHDTRGGALANVELALAQNISIFDSAAGGTGGCPFAPGAPGNLATEALVGYLSEKGYETGIDRNQVAAAARVVRAALSESIR